MSDLCMYEFEDNVWDEFEQTDDHIVPRPDNERGIEPVFQDDGCKKPRREVIRVSSNAGDCYTAKFASQGKGEGGFQSLKNMLEKDSRSHTPEGVPASRDDDSNKEATSLASGSAGMSNHSFKSSNIDKSSTEFCADDPIIGESGAVVDSDSYQYPLGDISQTDNDISFFDNDHDDKESNDLLYYGWPDIGNFEDVDSLFRSCDSTFGLGGVGNEDDLSWFSSSHTIEGSEDALKPDVKFSSLESSPLKNIPEQHEPSKLNNASSPVNDSNIDSASRNYKSSFRASEGGELYAHSRLTFTNGSDCLSESKYEFTPKEQINFQKKQVKHHNQSEGKRKVQCLENSGSLHHTENLRFKGTNLSSRDSSYEVYPPPVVQKQKKNMGADSFGYLQTHIPYMHLDYILPSNQVLASSTPSGMKSESNFLTSPSPKESSYRSNQVQSTESVYKCSFETPAKTVDVKREKLERRQGFHSSCRSKPKHLDMVIQPPYSDPISVPEQVHHSQSEFENQKEVEAASIRIAADLDSSNVQESSCMSSGLGDISLEASSFHQLQQVVEQLDIMTKLCIRDSLYRLARSAEQRHHYSNLNGGSIDGRDTSGAFTTEGQNKCSGFVDMETDTNPIDRSIAHLLFHRPSDPSVIPDHDGPSLKTHTMINRSINGPPMSEKLVCQEETVCEGDKEAADH
ncbi:protein LNK1-like isoform X1 [Actinidia eriantha]|uniref:protein LNK1-like isoform X1 n=1 Tax=Actinidia eriantha TaxID=165200 RepID=UPI0025890B14|nr:protein LNK1-like isoform X1 [Actinidia eriantha]XP_057494513.1 protein LNK1-like isoform X1 [Actinidia eriantha]XP_057494514.1 protein LNK1-like isoform X1 [Actinidia eriantha]